MHDHNHQHHMGKQRFSTVPALLKAYPTFHSCMITAHASLGHLEKQWKLFTRQMIRTCQLLPSLMQEPAAPTPLLSGLEAELSNLNSILSTTHLGSHSTPQERTLI